MTRLFVLACFLFAIVLAGCSSSTTSSEKTYSLKGTVVGINAERRKIKINHEEIPGLMRAMEMPFDFEDAKVVEDLAAGDAVEGKLKVVDSKYIVTELRKTGSAGVEPSKGKSDPEAEIKASLAKLPDGDRKAAVVQKLCPVTDERLGSMDVPVKISLKGESIFLCCKACQKTAEKDPDATLKKVAELKKK